MSDPTARERLEQWAIAEPAEVTYETVHGQRLGGWTATVVTTPTPNGPNLIVTSHVTTKLDDAAADAIKLLAQAGIDVP